MTEAADPAVSPDRAGARPGGPSTASQRWRWPMIVLGPLLILGLLAYFSLTSGRAEVTDNAYVQIAKAPVAPQIGGRVTDIYVHENQAVRRGQLHTIEGKCSLVRSFRSPRTKRA